MAEINIGLVGAGVIGKKHALAVENSSNCKLAAIVDVTTEAKKHARALGVPFFASLEELFQGRLVDGVILATPSDLHKNQGLLCAKNNIPVLIEKPLATTISDAEAEVELINITNGVLLSIGDFFDTYVFVQSLIFPLV